MEEGRHLISEFDSGKIVQIKHATVNGPVFSTTIATPLEKINQGNRVCDISMHPYRAGNILRIEMFFHEARRDGSQFVGLFEGDSFMPILVLPLPSMEGVSGSVFVRVPSCHEASFNLRAIKTTSEGVAMWDYERGMTITESTSDY